MKQTSDIIWVVCNKLTTVWAPTKNLLVSWQFSGPYGVTKYSSGWRKDVVNQCLEYDSEYDTWQWQNFQYLSVRVLLLLYEYYRCFSVIANWASYKVWTDAISTVCKSLNGISVFCPRQHMADGLVLVVIYVDCEVYMPSAHLEKGSLKPHHCQY